jgi:putative aldouronate transport system substrate-binding protein
MKKKIVSLLVVLAMLMALMASCAQDNNSGDAVEENTVEKTETSSTESTDAPQEEVQTIDEVTFVMRSFNQVDWEGSSLDQLIQERFGIKFDIQIIDMSSFAEKFTVMFNTNNLPDISTVYGISISELNEAGDAGRFLNYFDYIDVMPELKKILTENKSLLPALVSKSGALYYSPIYYGMGEKLNGKGIAVRKDLLDKAGFDYSNLESMDDLYAMLKALKDSNPDKYVTSHRRGGLGDAYTLGNMMGVSGNPATWDVRSSAWVPTYDQPGMKDFITFWKNAYEEGILHPDFMTMSGNDMWQMVYSGELTAFIDAMAYADTAMDNAATDDIEWTYVMAPKYDGYQYGISSNAGFGWVNQKIVNASTEAPEKIFKFLDWLYSDEGFMRSWHGEEGVDYALVSESPLEWISFNETYKSTIPEEYHDKLLTAEEIAARKIEAPYYLYGFYSKNLPYGIFNKNIKPNIDTIYEQSYYAYDEAGVYGPADPPIVLGDDELAEFNDLRATINDYANEMVAQMITGQIDMEATWPDFIETIDAYGYDRLMELYAISQENFNNVEPDFNP